MIEPFPKLDERRASELYEELLAVASVMLPNWNKGRNSDDFANALLQITARLGEQVTTRMSRTPQRDALSFFDMLDIPVQPPHPSTAPVVFQLAADRKTAAIAPARTQIGASTDEDELLFETQELLNLTPARLEFMAAVDATEDRITSTPHGFLLLEPRETNVPDYRAASFASTGSKVIQIEPSVGLEKKDQIRIGNATYRLAGENEGLFELVDALEANVSAGDAIVKVQDFNAFDTRDLQEHGVYIGHEDLFNLEDKSTITLDFEPAGVAAQLSTGVSWSMYATADGKDEPEWEPLKLVGASFGIVTLQKDWPGKVEMLEVGGQKSRWLRARYDEPISTQVVAGTRVRRIRLKVSSETVDETDAEEEALKARCLVSPTRQKSSLRAVTADAGATAVQSESTEVLTEGSNTIDQAFHNGSPLPLTSRFYPFGPEPRRFDTFSIAAPEAFSKPGATVTLDIATTDASILAMQVTTGPDEPHRAYGVAHNGSLQLLIFDDGQLRWRELDRPEIANLADSSGVTAPELELLPSLHPQSIQLQKNGDIITDVIIARDKRGALWSKQVEIDTSNTDDIKIDEPWTELPAPPGDQPIDDIVVVRRDVGEKLVVFSISGDQLYFIDVDRLLAARNNWIAVTASGAVPTLGANARLVAVQPKNWPDHPTTSGDVRIVVIDHVDAPGTDSSQALWTTTIDIDLAGPTADATWTEHYRPDSSDPWRVDAAIKPAATINVDDELSVFAAIRFPTGGIEPFVFHNGSAIFDTFDPGGPVRLAAGSTFHSFPQGFGGEPLGVIQGVQESSTVFTLWSAKGEHDVLPAPVGLNSSDLPSTFVLPVQGAPTLVVNGGIEQLYLYTLPEPAIGPNMFHGLVLQETLSVPSFVEPKASAASPSKIFQIGLSPDISETPSPVISQTQNHVYAVHPEAITNAGITPEPDDWKIWQGSGNPETGKLVSAAEGKMKLKSGEDADVGEFILVDDLPFTVSTVTGDSIKMVTFTEPLPGTDGDQLTYEKTTEGQTVADVDLLTLIGFRRPAGATLTPERLVFATDGGTPNPATRAINVQVDPPATAPATHWVLLDGSWDTLPGPKVSAQVVTTATGAWMSMVFPRGFQNPELAWEYLNDNQWRRLEKNFIDTTAHLAKSGNVVFTVPDDLKPGDVAGQEDYWIRARLVGGDYGRPEYRVTTTPDPNDPTITTQAITIDTTNLNPPEIIRINAKFSVDIFVDAEQLLVHNNLDMRNQTQANSEQNAEYDMFVGAARLNQRKGDSNSKAPAEPDEADRLGCTNTRSDDFLICSKSDDTSCCGDVAEDCTSADADHDETDGSISPRAIYFGFNRAFGVNRLSFFVDAVDQAGAVDLEFDVFARNGWERVSSSDETHGFYRRGFVTVGIDFEPRQATALGGDRYWVRAVPSDGGAGWSPVIRQLFVNAGAATQARTVLQEIVGSSTGEQGQKFTLANHPVLPDKLQLRVRKSLNEEEIEALNGAAEARGDELPAIVQYDALSIKGHWVLWQRVDSFVGYSLDDRVYRLDPVKGEIQFGVRTKAPPGGANNLRAVSYQSGGGTLGNVDAFNISALKSPVEAVEMVANPVAASGGSDQPDIDEQIVGAPARLQGAGHALMPPDIESICVAFSPDIVRARCLPARSSGDPVRVAVAARTGERCPQLTRALQDGLRARIRDHAWGALRDDDINIETPGFVRVTVSVRLLASDPSLAAELEQRAKESVRLFMHPVDGGPHGKGWPFGRPIWKSDVLRVLATLPGFDRVEQLDLEPLDPAIELKTLAGTQMVCAEDDDIRVQVVPGGGS